MARPRPDPVPARCCASRSYAMVLLASAGADANAGADRGCDNARAALAAIDEHGSLDAFLWSFVDGKPVKNAWRKSGEVPATTPISDRMSKVLAKRGFRFVGSTICYAFMQATGMVNDHLVGCFRYKARPARRAK